MKVKNPTTGNWDTITLGGGVTIDNSLSGDSTTHGASVHAVNQGLAGKISGDGSVEKVVKSTTTPSGTEATLWIEPDDFTNAETAILKDTLEDADLDKAPTVHAVKQAIDNIDNIDYDSIPSQGKIEYTGPVYTTPTGYTKSEIPYSLESLGDRVEDIEDSMVYPLLGYEKVIGIFYDGKPIYKYCALTTKSQVATLMSARNIDFLISTQGSYAQSNYNNNWPIPSFYPQESGYNITMFGSSTGNVGHGVSINFGDYYGNNNQVFLCLEYTKTTDNGRAVLITDSSN